MDTEMVHILTINAGSSSIKFALFAKGEALQQSLEGSIEKIGQAEAALIIKNAAEPDGSSRPVHAPDHAAAAKILADWLEHSPHRNNIVAVGHRIVHGGPKYDQPYVITEEVAAELRQLSTFDPEHLPVELNLVEVLQKLFPAIPHIVCFDTAFHHNLPRAAQLLPIPRRYNELGLRRYGFHGLSYGFLVQELERLEGKARAHERLVLAHLGNGVSLAAVHHGKSIDTTMGLTPAGGVPMSSRSGDLDPGLLSYLMRVEKIDAGEFNNLVNFQSGLLGISATSSDMQELLAAESRDERAAEAIAVFCYQVKKAVGGLAAALGGLDQLVFTGGMGENAPKIRARICEGLEFLGIKIDAERNAGNDGVISAGGGPVTVRVIHTDEARIIAQDVVTLLSAGAHLKKGTA